VQPLPEFGAQLRLRSEDVLLTVRLVRTKHGAIKAEGGEGELAS
jgi:hypothetical protein